MSGAPLPFALGEAPEPATWPEADQKPPVTGLDTHTGTDPLGRAIGPAEDPSVPKLDADGLRADQRKPARKRGTK